MKTGIKLAVCAAGLLVSCTAKAAPARAALVDTGYDVCVQSGGVNCKSNRNLLFRGNVPLNIDNNYRYSAAAFREKIFSYLQDFKQTYTTGAVLPDKAEDLKKYRIVIINLLYDWTEHGKQLEYDLLTNEFKQSGAVNNLQIPQQHKMYNLNSAFDPNTFAFEWWPITMLGKDNHNGIPGAINWPEQETMPVPNSDQHYLPMDMPYLVTGNVYAGDVESSEAVDLRTLLAAQPHDGHPLLVFYHCYAGIDRTGSITLAYLMTHGGYANISKANQAATMTRSAPLSYQTAWAATTNEHYPEPDEEAVMAGKAYCEFAGKKTGECE